MKLFILRRLFLLPFLFSSFFMYAQAQSSKNLIRTKTQWVSVNQDGKLSYKTLEKGDRIMDFSYAGYRGGGVSIPAVTVQISLSPVAGDNTDAIQQAIDKVS